MATLIHEASVQTDPAINPNNDKVTDTVVITDMQFETNERTASTIDLAEIPRKTSQLKLVDEIFGPLQMGNISITRVALDSLGATFEGNPLNGRNTFSGVPKRSFFNALQLDLDKVEHAIKTATGSDSYLLPTLLFEMASQRPLTAPPLFAKRSAAESDPGNYRRKLIKLANAAQTLDLQHVHLPKHDPRWKTLTKSYATLGSSIGIQGFGIFMGLRGVVDAIKADNTPEIVLNGVGVASELGSIAVDLTVSKMATEMLTAGQHAFRDFARTRMALRLGRSGGLVGGALTLPFDIFTAVRSMNAAANTTGKEAMDHYVSAGLSITSAAMTLILGAAAMAGFSFAGPVGLAAGALLAIGSQVYGAVRVVDDIDDYIELTVEERWRTGWFSFCMLDIDQDIQDRYLKAKTLVQHSLKVKTTTRQLLDGPLKDSTEAIVNGQFEVQLRPTRAWKRHWWTKRDAWVSSNVPEIVGLDDTIDAREGVTKDTPGAELGTAAEHKGILWLLAEGRDAIQGVEKKPNVFHYKSGRKQLTGGEKDDRFVFENAADFLKQDTNAAEYSTLRGGEGNDTLMLGGRYSSHLTNKTGYDVDLLAGTLQIISTDQSADQGKKYALHSLIDSIENVETVDGAASVVTGTAQPNIIKARGSDVIEAGAGDDRIYLSHRNAKASGEAGADQYFIAHVEGRFSIYEDGKQASYIVLNWKKELIDSWKVEDNDLIITSGFEFLDIPKNILTIHDVYKKEDNERVLINKNLIFITGDGYSFSLDLPEKISDGQTADIPEIFIKLGQPQKSIIVYSDECWIRHQQEASYYVPRSGNMTTFYSVDRPTLVTRIYLDYRSDELTKAEAHFFAVKHKSYPLTAGCHLVYHFGEKRIKLNYFAAARNQDDHDNLTKILRTMAARPFYRYVLIFNDGVAINAGLTAETDALPAFTDYAVPRNWITPMTLPLAVRSRRYSSALPESKAHETGNRNGCVTLVSLTVQTAMESLIGAGARYLIHLVADMTIKLSTPGALAKSSVRLAHSSTWELDATKLGPVEIKLTENRLSIGTCAVHLPVYEAEDLIDQIRVITENGIVHTVDLVFDQVYRDGLDARFFEEPDASQPLPAALRPFANDVVKVSNAQWIFDETAALSYSFAAHGWVLRADNSRVEASELQVTNRCGHQTRIFEVMPPITVPPA
ncbi:MAG TPA: calcium-binding protein [Pseudomonas sp.]|uniref:calcium-binding protein n=1 Tax=Pseudomonas sp. TaxID=306 RepID=UPI002CC72063|nr:calcium-binding protein [Pseudomonas sp.]HWH85184.1 calcium-binding protein [Pseudomonas sp.]